MASIPRFRLAWKCNAPRHSVKVAQLQGLTELRYLHLKNCKEITDAGLAELKKTLPKCKIMWV